MQKYKVGDVVTVIESKNRCHHLKHNTLAAVIEVFFTGYMVLGQDYESQNTIVQIIDEHYIKV